MHQDIAAHGAFARRRFGAFFAGIIATLVVSAPMMAQTPQPEVMKVNGDRVNLRVAPSVDSGVVRALASGTLVVVINRDGGWTKVQVKGQTVLGWIRSNLLAAVPAAAATPATQVASAPPPPPATKAPPAQAAPTQAAAPPPQRIAPPAAPPIQGGAVPGSASYKDPATATLISVLITGGGQFYAGDTGRGLLLLGGGYGSIIIGCAAGGVSGCELGALGWLGFWVYGIIDASPTARRMNAANGVKVGLIPIVMPGPQSRVGFAVNVQF